jgi:hypothetical protein
MSHPPRSCRARSGTIRRESTARACSRSIRPSSSPAWVRCLGALALCARVTPSRRMPQLHPRPAQHAHQTSTNKHKHPMGRGGQGGLRSYLIARLRAGGRQFMREPARLPAVAHALGKVKAHPALGRCQRRACQSEVVREPAPVATGQPTQPPTTLSLPTSREYKTEKTHPTRVCTRRHLPIGNQPRHARCA